jgi:hypothetical protein
MIVKAANDVRPPVQDETSRAGVHSDDTSGAGDGNESVQRPSGTRRVSGHSPKGRGNNAPVLHEPGADWLTRDAAGIAVLAVSVLEVGCFYVRPESPGRWRVFNRLLGHQHVTYGTLDEVTEQLELQTRAWERRYANSGGIAKWSWRNHMFTGTKADKTGS